METTFSEWNEILITDKSGNQFFKRIASPGSTHSEISNLKTHLKNAKKNPCLYSFLDIQTAVIQLNGKDIL